MNKINWLFIYFLILCFSVNAQIEEIDFGNLTKEEFLKLESPKDKDAEAYVLYDRGISNFIDSENGFDVVFERVTRIKVYTEAGLDYADIEIPFYREGDIYEEISSVEAYVYNLEGELYYRTNLQKKEYHDEKINERWINRKIALPNVKPGSVIEYKYKVTSQYLFNLRDWEFQWEIPVKYSEYQVSMIPFYEYTFLLQGASRFTYQDSREAGGLERVFGSIRYHDMINRYVMKDVEAFKNEGYITSVDDYILKIDFQLARVNYPDGRKVDILKTWPDMIDDLLKENNFGKYVKKSQKISAKIFDVDHFMQYSEEDRFNHAIDYVKDNFNWNGRYGKYAWKTPSELMKDKVGNVAELNLLALGILKSLGIEAEAVILSTRNNGKIRVDYPFSKFFNYVIILANVNGKPVLTDVTNVLASNKTIPVACLNGKGLIIKKGQVSWVGVNSKEPSVTQTFLDMNLTDSIVNTKFKIEAKKYYGLAYRTKFEQDKEKVSEFFKDKGYGVSESSISISNFDDPNKKYILEFAANNNPEIINGKYYVCPFLNEAIKDNKFKQNSRSYPIDMEFIKGKTYFSMMNIPDGYKVDYLPKEVKVNNEEFELNYSAISNSDKVTVSFYYKFKQDVYSAAMYGSLKYYFNEIIKLGNDKVVFVKE